LFAVVKGEGDLVAFTPVDAVAKRLKSDKFIHDCLNPPGA